jgi:hypothetical protein
MAIDNPIIAIVLLFIVVFAFFFLMIYGILSVVERRKASASMPRQRVPSSAPSANLTTPRLSSSASTKFCLKCGTQIPRIADYCPECGTQQIPV